MAVEEPDRAGGRADSVREVSEAVCVSCFVRHSAFAVAVHEPVCLSVSLSSSRLKISPAKSKQITYSRKIGSCCLVYLERIALSELANCMTVISWPRTCVSCLLLLMQPYRFKLPELHFCFIIRPYPSPLPPQIMLFSINPYPTAFPYGNGMVLHFYQQQESSTTKTVHKVINKGLKTYV